MEFSRRRFLSVSALLGIGSGVASLRTSHGQVQDPRRAGRPCFVSTWSAGKVANELALKTVADGGSVLDAVEQAIRLVEADERNSSVGIGGIPNAEGVVQLDACIMDGPVHGAGSVAALEGILHPISVARRVMEQTSHVMLVGEGARQFALQQGFPSTHLLTEERRKDWLAWKRTEAAKREPAPASHDTIALVGVDDQGNMAGGCSTSGWGYKLPGRVGDSPIIGSGLYVDNQIGAAGATGVGENVMRYCGSFMVVEAMRAGMDPTEACVSVIRRIAEKDPKDYADLHINFIALSRDGRYGAAGTDQGFDFAVADRLTSQVFSGTRVEP